jgi:phosphoheptose isomerase
VLHRRGGSQRLRRSVAVCTGKYQSITQTNMDKLREAGYTAEVIVICLEVIGIDSRLELLHESGGGMSSVLESNIDSGIRMLEKLRNLDPLVTEAANKLAQSLLSGHKLLACGNGGSAADASHLTTEFVSRFNRERRPYPAISLATHGGDITAIGNDYAFEDLFVRQIGAFGLPGDVLAAFTTSGRSENVRRALIAAQNARVFSIAFLGRDGGNCTGLADIELLVREEVTARIQEGHKFLLHTICELVEEKLFQQE